MTLSAEQSRALASVLCVLQYLSASNLNRFRIAQLGAIPTINALYEVRGQQQHEGLLDTRGAACGGAPHAGRTASSG